MALSDPKDHIFATKNFILERSPKPFLSLEEGGHMRIFAKRPEIVERRDFTPNEAVEFIWFSSIAGQALEQAMKKQGINIEKINFEELGNWAYKYNEPYRFHEHIFGRALGSVHQNFPEAVQLPDRSSGFYDNFVALTDEDMANIRTEIEIIARTPKYTAFADWKMEIPFK